MPSPRRPLALAVLVGLATAGGSAAAAETARAAEDRAGSLADAVLLASLDSASTLENITVEGEALPDPRFPNLLPELSGTRATAGKKITNVALDEQPAIVDNNARQLFARVPGLFVSEQQYPSIFNVNYRGLGDPHESEYVLFMEDGLPITSDWFGYPTLYYMPAASRIERVEFIRGGSGLMYGPQIGPVVNFVTRRADPGAASGGISEHAVGSNGYYGTYNEARGGNGEFGWMASFDHRGADGQRAANSAYRVNGGNVGLGWQQDEDAYWAFDFTGYDSGTEEPGRLTLAQYAADPDQTTTPFNRIDVERWTAKLSHERRLGDAAALGVTFWHGYQDRYSRRAAAFVPPQPPPSTTSFDRQEFQYTGLDARVRVEWGSNHTLAAGFVGFHDDSPREQRRGTDLTGGSGSELRYAQERDTRYVAAFAENVFRFGSWRVVPALRIERLELGIDETVKLPSLRRAAIDVEFSETVPLLGLGVAYDSSAWQAYGNLSEGYRPFRYDDVGNPTAELVAGNGPDSTRSLNFELGIRGEPLDGVYYDVSVFHIDVEDRIEQRQVNAADVERVNTGDSRHRGIEGAIEWDLMRRLAPSRGDSLKLFANAALLDAEITASLTPSLVGNTPAFAPDYLIRTGVLYRSVRDAKLALVGTFVDEQFFQDSNAAHGSGSALIPAQVPSFEVWDLTAEYPVNARFAVFGGISNLFDEQYYARIRTDGIEPAAERTAYAGVRLTF